MGYTGGRWSIWKPKDGRRFQGSLTAEGTRIFERRRELLAGLAQRDTVSDADVVESFMRGVEDSAKAIAKAIGK
jgi:hypothetical protein